MDMAQQHAHFLNLQDLEAAGLCHDGRTQHAEALGLVLAIMAERCRGKQSRCAEPSQHANPDTRVCLYRKRYSVPVRATRVFGSPAS